VSPNSIYAPPPPQRSGLAIPLLTGGLIAMVAANIFLYVQLDHFRTDTAQKMDKLTASVASMRDASSVSTAAQARHIEALKEELASANEQARTMSSQAKVEMQAHADKLAKQLEAEQAKMQQQVSGQISDVNQSVTQANAKIADVSTDLGSVKSQAAMTQSQLDKTIADLKSVTGDMGVQSGLIATNGRELQALKMKGERNYFDIKLGKTKKPVRFADISLQLKSADRKRNKYTVNVLADDKLYEKKDKNANEPVQFYTAKSGHAPYELVINQINKDQIVGYLATPKDAASR
jgi:septal ring factor EnvC (AmiA/AmiB activator)